MKNLKLFVIAIFVAFGVIVVANMDKAKENMSWVFEDDESQVALPELSNKEIEETASKNGAEFEKRPAPAAVLNAPLKEVEKETITEEEI